MRQLITLVFLAFSLNSFAQVRVGVKVGGNASKLVMKTRAFAGDAYGYRSLAAVHGGAYLDLNLTERLQLSPELLYMKRGARMVGVKVVEPATNEVLLDRVILQTHCLTMPVMVGYRLGKSWKLTFGPEVTYIMGGNLVEKPSGVKVANSVPKVDFALNAGLRVDLPSRFHLALRYSHGLRNMLTGSHESSGVKARLRNQTAVLSLGYRLW